MSSFLEGHRKVDGLLIRHEELAAGQVAAIEDYLGFGLSCEAARVNPRDGGPPPLEAIPEEDACTIEEELGRLAASLDYHLEESRREAAGQASAVRASPRRARSTCVILVPYRRFIEPACETGLRELERRGYAVRRVPVDAGIDLARSEATTEALGEGFDELMWVDPDLEFDPEAVDHLRSLERPLACGIYPRRRPEGLVWNVAGEAATMACGPLSSPIEVAYADAGFLFTWREVYLAIQQRQERSPCPRHTGGPFFPFFLPLIVPEEEGPRYLTEGFSFCVRARRCGFSIVADPRIRPRPIFPLATGWEDIDR